MKHKCTKCKKELKHVVENYYVCSVCKKKYIKKMSIEKVIFAIRMSLLVSVPQLDALFYSKWISLCIFIIINMLLFWFQDFLYYIWSDKQFIEIKEDNL